MNFSEMAENVGLSVDEFVEIAHGFIEATHSDLLQLRAAIRASLPEQISATAHSIKGAALTFGFEQMHEAALTVERQARENTLDSMPEAVDRIETELGAIAEALQHIREIAV
ncbi:MAG: Hpt domain-containing protein [Syntrophobacteraceae bacterium]|jgi:HPt (histidine-containing phosphotransfer) domain-containing protein|nr:Hpt domain-containing protein [Syntrophobacteraceae bacterium]MCU0588606.1 Hpt domain-containing protein [Syntrophobacteraceae bacterium]